MLRIGNIAAKTMCLTMAVSLGLGALTNGLLPQPARAAAPYAHLEEVLRTQPRATNQMLRAYEGRAFKPVWTAGDGAAARALRDAISELPMHALPPMPEAVEAIDRFLSADPVIWKNPAVELRLMDIFLTYSRARRRGVIVPQDVDPKIKVTPRSFEDFELLEPLMQADDPISYLQSLGPVPSEYLRLHDMLTRMQAIVHAGGWGREAIASGELIIPRGLDPRIPAIRARLIKMGDHPAPDQDEVKLISASAPVSIDAMRYDPDLEAAVLRFQERHGLNPDGLIGDATLAVLNVPAVTRLQQVAVNLERLRWRSAERERDHIYVNLPDYRVEVQLAWEKVFETRAVIGREEGRETPEFSHRMTFLVANPTWTVPKEIAVADYLPLLQQNPDFLSENNMTLIRGGSTPIPDDVSTIDWFAFSESFFPFWLRQSSGPWNALGRLKFMFPNEDDIYLHDTPQRGLFRRDVREGSSGCVRLEDPIGLAHVLLAPNYPDGDVETQLETILASGEQTELPLRRMMPIHLDYRTSWVEADGTMNFRQDIYARDAAVYEAMQQVGVNLS
jgi:murein L,D-transpeptidase YcbB/YkuD